MQMHCNVNGNVNANTYVCILVTSSQAIEFQINHCYRMRVLYTDIGGNVHSLVFINFIHNELNQNCNVYSLYIRNRR